MGGYLDSLPGPSVRAHINADRLFFSIPLYRLLKYNIFELFVQVEIHTRDAVHTCSPKYLNVGVARTVE